MNDFDLSRAAGLKASYLAMTKCNNRPKYDLLKQVGIEGYKDLVFSLRHELSIIHRELTEKQELAKFGRAKFPDVSYKTLQSRVDKLAYSLFDGIPSYRSYTRLNNFIEAYKEYKNETTY